MDPFVFIVCQYGAEQPLKKIAIGSTEGPTTTPWRLAFSRPGLLTLKYVGEEAELPEFQGPLVRLSGKGLGTARAELAEDCFEKVWQLATRSPQGQNWDAIHIFQRDRAMPGFRNFEPGPSELSQSIAEAFERWLAARDIRIPINQVATPGQMVLDIILSEPNQWFVGCHKVRWVHEAWPGGVPPIVEPPEMISRAYLKIAEALMWSQLPIATGDAVVEIGSAPGGASQRLLDIGLMVTGVDAAEMDELVLGHPRFEHWRSKAAAVKRKLYHKCKWLVCDANVAPNYTLDVLGDIFSQEGTQIEGMILTFKLSSWDTMKHLDEQLERIRHLGFPVVAARQLAHNRHELCVVAKRAVRGSRSS